MRVPCLALRLLAACSLVLPSPCQEAHHITLPQPQSGDYFGMAVDLDGELALAGRLDNHKRGAGYLVDLATGGIVRQFDPSTGDNSAGFGRHVALSGSHVVVAAPKETRNHLFSGAVHLYDRDTGATRAIFSGEQVWHWFGASLDARGDWLLIGASGDDSLGYGTGSAYVADLAGATLGPKLLASDGAQDHGFGYDVALGSDRAAVGAPGAGGGSGAVYLFDVATWTEVAKLVPLDLGPDDSFGSSVAVDGDRLIVAATSADTMQGAVYVFELSTGALLRRIPSPTGQPGQFGFDLDLHGNLAIISGAEGPYLVDIDTGLVIRQVESCAGQTGAIPVAIGAAGVIGGWFTETVDDFDGAGGVYVWTDFGGGDLGWNYCGPANPNSTGGAAHLAARGCAQVQCNLFELRASRLPPMQPGFPIVSRDAGFVPFAGGSQGTLCLGGTLGRAKSLLRVSDGSGQVNFPIDLMGIPQGATTVAVQPGETWRFQVWFRDMNPQATSNFTEGLAMRFD